MWDGDLNFSSQVAAIGSETPQPRKKRPKKRSKQKNLKRDTRLT